ncbi:MAG: hypothetical protein HY870_20320 [Chloroflexi bacterium]|nr:hypothetical protein [Chloroflexota bacterium]
MAAQSTFITLRVPLEVVDQLPTDPTTRTHVLELGLRQWRVIEALEKYRQGHGTLAYAAEQAGVSLREIIPLAYAHGLTPPADSEM